MTPPTVVLKAPSSLAIGSPVYLPDGSLVYVDADGQIEVASTFQSALLNAGFELTATAVGGTSDATAGTVMERDENADTAARDFVGTLLGGVDVINKTGSSIAAGKLVAIAGLDTTSGKPKIVLADADVAAHDDVYATTAAIANNAEGRVYKGALSAADLNTNSASTAGDPVYLDVTAGGFAHTAPTGATARVLPVGFVVVKSATVGQIRWFVSPVRSTGTNEQQDASITLVKVAPATLDGTVAKVVAAAAVIGGLMVIHQVDLAAGALADTDVVLTHKTRVIDAHVVLRGAGVANTTLTVQNGATPITNALDVSGSDKALVRAATLDDAAWEIAAAGTLRIKTETGATQPACTVYVIGYRVA